MKKFIWAIALCFACANFAQADLILTGVIDGDLSGGNPKAIIVTATADIGDLSIYGLGSANNGGGTDGEEFTFGTAMATAGDVFVLAGNTASSDFFTNSFSGLTVFTDGAANINGDDAVELFMNGAVLDTYGVVDVNGDGESWDYTDGYAVRTGGVAGTFDQANYTSVFQGLDGFDESSQVDIIATAFGFTAVPEPTAAVLFSLAGLGLCVVRRRS